MLKPEIMTINQPPIMNQKIKILLTSATVAGLWLAAPGSLKAQVLQTVSISGTMLAQGTNTDNNTTSTTKAPTRTPITTASVLKQLALDEYAAGNYPYPNTKFPPGAKLKYLADTGFQVDNGTNELVDVSDILSLEVSGTYDINAGSYSDANGQGMPPSSQTDYQLVTVTYDSTAVGGTTKYTVTGLATSTTRTTNPSAKGNYSETASFSLQSGTGEGINAAGVNIVITGFTITASGSAAQNNGAGS
jgi:hypothetical protein